MRSPSVSSVRVLAQIVADCSRLAHSGQPASPSDLCADATAPVSRRTTPPTRLPMSDTLYMQHRTSTRPWAMSCDDADKCNVICSNTAAASSMACLTRDRHLHVTHLSRTAWHDYITSRVIVCVAHNTRCGSVIVPPPSHVSCNHRLSLNVRPSVPSADDGRPTTSSATALVPVIAQQKRQHHTLAIHTTTPPFPVLVCAQRTIPPFPM